MDFFFGLRLTSKVIFSAPNDFLFENVYVKNFAGDIS